MIRRLLGRDRRPTIVLWMRRREVAAAKCRRVVLLLAVIGKRLAGKLPTADPATIGERREEECVHRSEPLEVVEHGIRAFVNERHRADLHADHWWLGGRYSRRGSG